MTANRQTIDTAAAAMRARKHGLIARKQCLLAQIAEAKADRQRQRARARLMGQACYIFGLQAMNRAELLTPETVRALQAQRQRLLKLFGEPRPGSDCVADAFELMDHGYRTRNQTVDDMVQQSLHKFAKALDGETGAGCQHPKQAAQNARRLPIRTGTRGKAAPR